MQAVLPDDTMFYSDMTQFAYVAKETYQMPRPDHWHHPFGFGTLGYALPAAIGGKIARPDAPTIAIAGDYGFQYTIQELGTAAELGLTLPIILWDNEKLKEIEDSIVKSQIAPNAVIAQNPDFAHLSAAYGIAYTKPASTVDFQAALNAALNADGPTIIHLTPEISSSS
jgi:5-guanidino-2-oxopentanoate decarboxylase